MHNSLPSPVARPNFSQVLRKLVRHMKTNPCSRPNPDQHGLRSRKVDIFMNANVLVSALSICAWTLVGCGETNPQPDPTPQPEVKPTAAQLVGKWASACTDNGMGGGSTLTFDLSETMWKLDYAAYADAACAMKNLTVQIEGAYRLLAASTVVSGAREGEFDFDVRTVTPHNDGAVGFCQWRVAAGHLRSISRRTFLRVVLAWVLIRRRIFRPITAS
jgi:hypothetical protein